MTERLFGVMILEAMCSGSTTSEIAAFLDKPRWWVYREMCITMSFLLERRRLDSRIRTVFMEQHYSDVLIYDNRNLVLKEISDFYLSLGKFEDADSRV